MSHAFGEMYYLAMQVEHKRQIEQKRDPRKGALVFISPRAPKEFDTVLPSDAGLPVGTDHNTNRNTKGDTKSDTEDACVIM
jgi:hypothetical protein